MPDYEISYCSSHSDQPRRKHYNRKTFTAGDRFKWSKYSNQNTRTEYGYPTGCWYDTESKERYEFLVGLYGQPNEYGKTYRKWSGEPPRFNLKLILRKAFESRLNQGIKLKFRLLRFKDGFV